MMGRLDTIRSAMVWKAENSFPSTICPGVIIVVSIRSSVCLSRSPLMLLEVMAGMINMRSKNSMPAINR